MTLAVHASSPTGATSAVQTVTTASFTAPDAALLVAFIGYNTGGASDNHTVTDSGGLTWTLVGRKSLDAGSTGGTGVQCGAEIWKATTASSAARTVTSTATSTTGNLQQLLVVKVFTDTSAPTVGAEAATNSTSGLPTASLTTTAANSWVWSVSSDNAGLGAGTAGTAQTVTTTDEGTSLNPYVNVHVWRQTGTTSTSGTVVTNNLTAPAAQWYNELIVEILATPGGGGSNVALTLPAAGGGAAGWTRRARGLKTVAQWETSFLTVYATDHTTVFNPKSLSGDSWDYYNLGFGIDGVLAMFLATGNTAYLDRCILYANNMKASAVLSSTFAAPAYRDSYLGWLSQRSDVLGQEVPLFESFCWRQVVRMLRIIHDNATLASAYATDYAALLAFTETNIWDKWWTRDSTNLGLTPPHGGSLAMYRINTNMCMHWAWMAMHLKVMTANSARQTNCQAVKDNLDHVGIPAWSAEGAVGANMRTQLGLLAMSGDPLAYNWCSTWNSTLTADLQDISHAGSELPYIMDCWERGGQYWTGGDISKFMRTFTNHIFASDNTHSSLVDGSGGTGGYIADGWLHFGRYDVGLQRRFQAMSAEADNYGATTQWYGKGALNARYLLGR